MKARVYWFLLQWPLTLRDCVNVLVIKLLQKFGQPGTNLAIDMDGGLQWLCAQ
jgi:hypothetical protein